MGKQYRILINCFGRFTEKKGNSGLKEDINLQNQPDWHMSCIVEWTNFQNQFFILLSKMVTDSEDFMFSGINSHIFATR